jgi:hypothetical protein
VKIFKSIIFGAFLVCMSLTGSVQAQNKPVAQQVCTRTTPYVCVFRYYDLTMAVVEVTNNGFWGTPQPISGGLENVGIYRGIWGEIFLYGNNGPGMYCRRGFGVQNLKAREWYQCGAAGGPVGPNNP